MSNNNNNMVQAQFTWSRQRLYDRYACTIIYELLCDESCIARITNIHSKETRKYKPYPLATTEMQKRISRFLHIQSDKAMEYAEALYQKGMYIMILYIYIVLYDKY